MSEPAQVTPTTPTATSAAAPNAAPAAHKGTPGRDAKRVLHRVCIQCNNMFRVTPENFEAKQCSNCHKG
jgi:hypothetical protein